MEAKKNPKVDLENKKTLFLEIGLIVALAVVIIFFSVSQKEKVVEVMTDNSLAEEIEIIDVTVEEQVETPPVQQTVRVIADVLEVVRNDARIDNNFNFSDFNDEDIPVQIFEMEVEEIEEEAPFLTAEKYPSFQGGDINKFRNWVNARLRYPEQARENGIQGRVTVEFVVEKNGRITNIKALQSPDQLLSDEVIRIISSAPQSDWKPAEQRGQAVRFKYILPIEFKIQN